MVKWQLLDPQTAEPDWSSWFTSVNGASPFQSYAWGEYKRRHGWQPERWLARDAEGMVVCGLQALTKTLPFHRRLVWIPGGPLVGGANAASAIIGSWVAEWLEAARRRRCLFYVRFFSCIPSSPPQADAVRRLWTRPARPLNSGFTIWVDLSVSLEQLRAGMTAKHRYYVKQSEAAGLSWTAGSSGALVECLSGLHQEMSIAKGLRRVGQSETDVRHLQQAFGDECLLLVGSRGQRPVTACLVLATAGQAFYLMAATGKEGRAISASYAMIARLFDVLKQRGITRFDFGGIVPDAPGVAGVNHFKRGFGGDLTEYLGEWEWAPRALYRHGINAVMALRGTASY